MVGDVGGDVVEEGAFVKSLRRRKAKQVKMLWQHKTDMPIGVYDRISEDGDGLKVSGRLALGTQGGRDAYELLKMGAIDGLSIGYKADPAKQYYDDRRRKRYVFSHLKYVIENFLWKFEMLEYYDIALWVQRKYIMLVTLKNW